MRVLISQSHELPLLFDEVDCGFSGTVPENEVWTRVLVDNAWGAAGEYDVGIAGESVTVSRCHKSGRYIGTVEGKGNFHYMRKYKINTSLEPHDSINGVCILATVYNTPGIYESKEACELANKYKFTEEEFNQINQLINKIKGEKCG